MQLKSPLQLIFALFLAMLLTACAQMQSLGLPQPETFNQKLAVAYASVTQVRETAVQLLESGKISSADALNVQATADLARVGLDQARALHKVDPTSAGNKLTAVRSTLAALTAYLATKGG